MCENHTQKTIERHAQTHVVENRLTESLNSHLENLQITMKKKSVIGTHL